MVINLDPTALLLNTIPERQPPAALALRRGQPQPHQVAARGGGCVVRVGGAGVQDVRVGKELDVADVEDHVQRELVAGFLEDAQGFLLGVGEWRDDACV